MRGDYVRRPDLPVIPTKAMVPLGDLQTVYGVDRARLFGRWHRLGGKLVVAENNDYRLNAGGRREFAPDSPLEGAGFEPSVPPLE